MPSWKRYAVAAPLAALALTVPLRVPLERTSMLLFWGAVFVSASYGGYVAGLVSAVVSVVVAAYFVFAPAGSFSVGSSGTAVSLLGFLALALAASRLTDTRRRALALAEARSADLERTSTQLQDQAAELEAQTQELEEQIAESRALSGALRASETRLRQVAEAERQARERAEEGSCARSQFLALMSHELRTPLNAIGGYVELLELGIHGPLTGEQRTVLGRIRRKQGQLLELIGRVLDLAALGADTVSLAVEELDLATALDGVAAAHTAEAAARGVALEVAGGAGVRIRADRGRLRQIVDSLLGNAIKFTGRGGRVVLRWGEAGETACIEGRDSGVGIPESRREAIFEPFTQVEEGLTRRVDGAGLGLSTSRALAREMGGDVTVASRPGEGSVFRVLLPRPG